MPRLLIVDGHAYAYRAFHAIRELRSPTGQPTNAIYGFIKMLSKMRARCRVPGVKCQVSGGTDSSLLTPRTSQVALHCIVVWDGGLSAERMAALPEYKAQRPEMPADLELQIDEIVRYLEAANIASYCGEGVEADDYIACLARRAFQAGMEVVIASSDKDFMQLVTDEVSGVRCGASGAKSSHLTPDTSHLAPSAFIGLLNPNDKTEAVWTAEQVRAKAGVEPSQIVDWLSLLGDSVDNIPGVPGVGTKTAADLLKQFGSVEALYRRLDEVKSDRLRAALKASAEAVRRNRELVRLREDLPCDFSPEAFAERPADAERLSPLFQQWGFRSMLAELESSVHIPQSAVPGFRLKPLDSGLRTERGQAVLL